jgi:hypothetical protein
MPRRWRHDIVELSFKGRIRREGGPDQLRQRPKHLVRIRSEPRTSSPNHAVGVKLCVNAGTVPNRTASRGHHVVQISDVGMNGNRTVTWAGTSSRGTGSS